MNRDWKPREEYKVIMKDKLHKKFPESEWKYRKA